jgi:hypothetical protein
MARAEWMHGDSGWTAEANGWGMHVWLEEQNFGDPAWQWSLMRFANPSDDSDDRIEHRGGQATTKAKAMRAAEAAAKEG